MCRKSARGRASSARPGPAMHEQLKALVTATNARLNGCAGRSAGRTVDETTGMSRFASRHISTPPGQKIPHGGRIFC